MASKAKTYRLNNLSGGINSVSEINALASFDYNGAGVQAEAEDIENFIPLNRGGQSKTTGFSLYYNTASANKITGLYRYIQSGGTSLFLYSQTTKVYKLVAGTPTDIGATIDSGAYTHFETALDKCIICDGVNTPVTYDGASVASLGGTPPSGARQSLWYQNRLWIFSASSNPSLVYYSDAGTIGAGYAANFVQCDVNDCQKIVSINKYFIPGTLEPVILVTKERSAGVIIGDGSTGNPYTYVRTNQDTGGSSFRSAVQFGSDVAYLSPRGVTSYKTDSTFVNLQYTYLSERVRPDFQSLNATALSTSMAWYDWKKTRISFAVPEAGKSTPNVIWHFDTRLNCWYKERWYTGQDCTASFIDSDGTWYHGDSNGKIYNHGSNYNFNNYPINAFYKTGYMDFGDPSLFKHIRQARMMIRGNGTYNVGVSTKLNYGISTGTSHNIQTASGAYTWGSFTWGSFTWGAAPIRFPKFFPGGDFQNIQLIITQSGLDESLDIFELEFITEITGLF